MIAMQRGRKPAFLSVRIKLGLQSIFLFSEKKSLWVYWVKDGFSKRAPHPIWKSASGRARFLQNTSQ